MVNENGLRVLLKHFVVYGAGFVLLNAVGFFLIPIYARYLSTGEYGILEVLSRCLDVAVIISASFLGITSISFYSQEKDERRKKSVISTAIITLFCSSVIGLVVFLMAANSLNRYFFGNQGYLPLFWMTGFILLAELNSTVPMAFLQARMQSRLYILISIIKFLVVIGLTVVAVVVLKQGVKGVIFCNMVTGILFAGILMGYTLSKTGHGFDLGLFKGMLRFGLPFVPGSAFLFVLNNGDRFFISRLLDNSTLGVYALGYKIGLVVATFVLGPFLKVWGPFMFKLDEDSDSRKSFGRYFLYFTIAYCITALPLAIFSREIFRIISAKGYWDGYRVVPYVLVAYLFWSIAAFFDSGFYITRKTIYKPLILGSAAVLAFILYWTLIPTFGMMGAAYATVICFAVFSGLTWFFADRIYPVNYPLGKFVYVLGLGIALYLIGITFLAGLSPWLQVILKCVLALVYPGLIVASRVLDKGDLVAARLYVITMWGRITRSGDSVPAS